MSQSRDNEACLFGIGNRLYAWTPAMKEPRLVVERNLGVTAIAVGMYHKPSFDSAIFDASGIGCIHQDIETKIDNLPSSEMFNEIIALVVFPHTLFDHFKHPVINAWSEKKKHESALIAVIRQISGAGEGRLIFADIGDMGNPANPSVEIGNSLVQAVVIGGEPWEIYWLLHELRESELSQPHPWHNKGIIYRGMDKSKIAYRFFGRAFLVPYGLFDRMFLVCHYGNSNTHPEGVVVSVPHDRRTVLRWDPARYGIPNFIGTYLWEEKEYLLFGSTHPDWQDEIRIHTLPFRPASTKDFFPRKVGAIRYPLSLLKNTNPFCSYWAGSLSKYVNLT